MKKPRPRTRTLGMWLMCLLLALLSGGASALGLVNCTATAECSYGHPITGWDWSDGGAGGTFSPSRFVDSPTYTAPANQTPFDVYITLLVTATCSEGVAGAGSVVLTVHPDPHEVTVALSLNPSEVGGATKDEPDARVPPKRPFRAKPQAE
jgi:hypothetical protein